MARVAKKRRGIGATCSIAKRFLHPRKKVAECAAYHNKNVIDGLLISGRGEKKMTGSQLKPAIFFRHPSFEGIVLYCHTRYATVMTEGPEESFFPIPSRSVAATPSLVGPTPVANSPGRESTIATTDLTSVNPSRDAPPIPPDLFHSSNTSEDIAAVRNLGFLVDDDNDPAPENVPVARAPQASIATNPTSSNASPPYGILLKNGRMCSSTIESQVAVTT